MIDASTSAIERSNPLVLKLMTQAGKVRNLRFTF
jgi:hypothetical protein